MNILLTGSTGFVGKYLQKYIAETGVPAILFNLSRQELAGSVNDIQQILKIQKTDAVIHLAGKAHDLKKNSNPQDYYSVNTELTKKIFDAFLVSASKTFIMLSSVKAAADSVDGILTEDHKPNPQTDYGKSKLLAEQYILNAEIPAGKKVYILRPCMIHGPGNKGNLNLLYKVARLGIPYPLAAFENKRSFLSIGNLCFVIEELLLRDDIKPGIYQVSDEKPVSTNRLMGLFSEVLSKKIRLLRINKKMITTLAQIGDRLSLPLNSERLKKLTESYVVSNDKILYAIGKPFPASAEEGLRATMQSFNQ